MLGAGCWCWCSVLGAGCWCWCSVLMVVPGANDAGCLVLPSWRSFRGLRPVLVPAEVFFSVRATASAAAQAIHSIRTSRCSAARANCCHRDDANTQDDKNEHDDVTNRHGCLSSRLKNVHGARPNRGARAVRRDHGRCDAENESQSVISEPPGTCAAPATTDAGPARS